MFRQETVPLLSITSPLVSEYVEVDSNVLDFLTFPGIIKARGEAYAKTRFYS
jgi:hypothetical protein